MKVVILHPPLYPMNHVLFDELGKYVDLVVYSFGNYPEFHKNWLGTNYQKEAKNYKLIILDKGTTSFIKQFNLKAFMSLINEKPDVVLTVAFWIPSLYSSLLRKYLNFKFIIITDAIFETEKNIPFLKKKMREVICKNTDTFISASTLTSEYISTLSKQAVIKDTLQTIDVSKWLNELNTLPTKNQLRIELDLPLDKTILIGVGSFIFKKNWNSILRQISSLRNCIFVLVGDGELENEYKEIIQKNNLKEKVKIISRKEGFELKKYFKAGDIFIFPSFYDQFGYVVLEALASGMPVICSQNSGASTVIENGINGYVIDPNKDYQDEINLTISNLQEMSNNTLSSIKKYTIENKAIEYHKILIEVLDEKN